MESGQSWGRSKGALTQMVLAGGIEILRLRMNALSGAHASLRMTVWKM